MKRLCSRCNIELELIEIKNSKGLPEVRYIPEDENLIGKYLQYGDNGLEVIPLQFGEEKYQCPKCKHIFIVPTL